MLDFCEDLFSCIAGWQRCQLGPGTYTVYERVGFPLSVLHGQRVGVHEEDIGIPQGFFVDFRNLNTLVVIAPVLIFPDSGFKPKSFAKGSIWAVVIHGPRIVPYKGCVHARVEIPVYGFLLLEFLKNLIGREGTEKTAHLAWGK